MKARNRKTGEIVDIIAFSPYLHRDITDYVSYIDSKGIEHNHEQYINYYWDFEPVEEHCSNVDLKQRRYEIAKAAMQGLLANPDVLNADDVYKGNYADKVAYSAVCYADALIRELKGEQND